MAAFTYYTTLTTAAATATIYPYPTTNPIAKVVSYVPSVPVGQPLRMPPQEGIWIAEKAKGAKSRKIIEVVCGSHVVCEGKRHSVIKWANLSRYVEVDPPWDSLDGFGQFIR